MHLRPFTLVRYEREPYFSNIDDYARVTFDTCIRAQVAADMSFASRERGWRALDDAVTQRTLDSMIVLELKFTTHVPLWLVHIVERLGLTRRAFSKYGTAIRAFYAPVDPADPSPRRGLAVNEPRPVDAGRQRAAGRSRPPPSRCSSRSALTQMLGAVYVWTFRGMSYSQGLVHAIVLGSIIACMLMLAIGNSIAAGLGIAGGLAIVRFRTALRDPRDMMFVFAGLGTGIASGLGAHAAADLRHRSCSASPSSSSPSASSAASAASTACCASSSPSAPTRPRSTPCSASTPSSSPS
jgi:hypothetical protein